MSDKKKHISFHRYWIGQKEKREILDTLDSGWITTGPKTRKFEEKFASYVRANHAVGLTSGTAALHLSLLALGIGKGDEVITTPMTFVATVNAIIYTGARPVLVDVEPDTLNISSRLIEKKINRRTKAILPVHYAGQPCDMENILRIARRHRLFIVEDAAHALESEYKGRKIGSISDLTCFSFHPIKNITTGEGGMVTTNNAKLADRVRILRLHGMDKSAWKRYEKEKFRHWDMTCLGYKYNMTDIQASLGIHQLDRAEYFWNKRKRLAARYDSILKMEDDIIILPEAEAENRNAYHLYPVRIRTENLKIGRDEIIDRLLSKNISASVHFRAVHQFSFYRKYLSLTKTELERAEYASDRLISLPLYPRMSVDEADYVASSLRYIVRHAAKNRRR